MKQSSISRHICVFILFISISGSACCIDFLNTAALGTTLLLGLGSIVQGELAIRNLRKHRRELIRSHLGPESGLTAKLEQQLTLLKGKETYVRASQGLMVGAALSATALIAMLKTQVKSRRKREKLTRARSASDLFSDEESHKEVLCEIENFLTLSVDEQFSVIQEKYDALLSSMECQKNFCEKRWRKDQKSNLKRLAQCLDLFRKLEKTDVEVHLPFLYDHYQEVIQPQELHDLQEYFNQIKQISNDSELTQQNKSQEVGLLKIDFFTKWDNQELFESILQKAIEGSHFRKAATW